MAEDKRAQSPEKQDKPQQDMGFGDIPRERMLELARHVAEILRYQKEHGLDDRGDPPEDDGDAER